MDGVGLVGGEAVVEDVHDLPPGEVEEGLPVGPGEDGLDGGFQQHAPVHVQELPLVDSDQLQQGLLLKKIEVISKK